MIMNDHAVKDQSSISTGKTMIKIEPSNSSELKRESKKRKIIEILQDISSLEDEVVNIDEFVTDMKSRNKEIRSLMQTVTASIKLVNLCI